MAMKLTTGNVRATIRVFGAWIHWYSDGYTVVRVQSGLPYMSAIGKNEWKSSNETLLLHSVFKAVVWNEM